MCNKDIISKVRAVTDIEPMQNGKNRIIFAVYDNNDGRGFINILDAQKLLRMNPEEVNIVLKQDGVNKDVLQNGEFSLLDENKTIVYSNFV